MCVRVDAWCAPGSLALQRVARAQGIRRALKRADARRAEDTPATRDLGAADASRGEPGHDGASDSASSSDDDDDTSELPAQAGGSASPCASLDALGAEEADATAWLAPQVEEVVRLVATSGHRALARLHSLRLQLQLADARLAAAEEVHQAARKGGKKRVLDSEFVVPPFSVWNCADGEYQKRKDLWAQTGLDDSVGRDKHFFAGRAEGIGGFTIRGATTSQFCPQLADVVRDVHV